MGFKVLVFGADWCVWCQRLKPEIAENKLQRKEVSFVDLDLTLPFNKEKHKREYNLICLPSAIVLENDIEVGRWDADQEQTFTQFLDKLL